MKSFKKIVTGLAVAGSAWFWSATTVFADNNVSLCPDQFAKLCNTNIGAANVVRFLVNGLLFIAFIAALVFLLYGGIRWIISGGDKENTAKAKGTVTASLIGLAIVLAAWIVLNVVMGFFGLPNLGNLNVPTLNNS